MPSDDAIRRAMTAEPLKEGTVTVTPPEHYVVEVWRLSDADRLTLDRIESVVRHVDDEIRELRSGSGGVRP